MKPYSKIIALAALVFLLALTGCARPASQAPTTAATPSEEVPFPADTLDTVSIIATQTAVAAQPPAGDTQAPEVSVATNTPEANPPAAGDTPAPTNTPEANPPAAGDTPVPTSTPLPMQPTPVIERPQTYTLQAGEFVYCIARRYNVDPSSLLSLNGLGVNTMLSTGATLKIPATGNWPDSMGARALKAHPTTYAVVAGESVYSIACKFGDVAPESILAANSLQNASDVKAGMSINIP